MENCLKRRDLDSDSDLDDSEDSDLDHDLETSLLSVDRKGVHGQRHHDHHCGLVSPYKRLRVEDLTCSSAESQCGETEAFSLLRSIDDGQDDLSWAKRSVESLKDDIGQSSVLHPPAPEVASSSAGRGSGDGLVPRYKDRTELLEFWGGVQELGASDLGGTGRELVKKGTLTSSDLRAGGVLPPSAEVREFPPPPALDKQETTPAASSTLEPDSLFLASYHPDFQTLESRKISYRSDPRKQSPRKETAHRHGDQLVYENTTPSRPSAVQYSGSVDLLEMHAGEDASLFTGDRDKSGKLATKSGDLARETLVNSHNATSSEYVEVSHASQHGTGRRELGSSTSTHFRSVGISAMNIPARVSPITTESCLTSSTAPSSQRDTNSDGISAVYDSVDSEPEGVPWALKMNAAGRLPKNQPKTTASSGVQTGDLQMVRTVFSGESSTNYRYTSHRDLPECVQITARSLPPYHGQNTRSFSWDDVHQQYQQYVQHQQHMRSHPFSSQQFGLGSHQIAPSVAPSAGEDAPRAVAMSSGDLNSAGFRLQARHSSKGSLQSQSSQESGGQLRSSQHQSKSSQESVEQIEKSYPSSLVVSGHKSKKLVLQSSGHLKISAYWNVGLLTVHVIQARCLSSSWSPHCDSYIKMSLVPDESRRTRCRTQVQLSTNNPVFDEKFSMEILEEDRRKRLLISVWHKDQSNGASEFLGCMSFGVQSLLQKDLDGWYHLLTEDVGRKKHLQAHTKAKPVLRTRSQQNIPQINKAFDGLERIVITIQRGKNGFGFSFVDEFPPKVGRVDRASPAEQAGVKKGDFVIRINGQNVSRSTCEGVAHLVKKMNPQSLTLELQRDHVVSQTVEITASGSHYPLHRSPYNKRGVGTSTDHLYESIGEHHKENRVGGTYGDEFMTDDETVYSQHDHTNQPGITSTPRPFVRPGHKTVDAPVARPVNKHESIHRLMSLELDFIDFMHYGIERYSRPLRHCIVSPHQHMTIFQNVEKLVTISEFHIKQIQDNASSVDSDTEDSQSSESSMFPNSVALIYHSKVHMLCQAYESYANGLARSNAQLRELRKNRDFMSFIREPPTEDSQAMGHLTISAFINRPVQHIHELYAVLNEIFAATPLHSADFSTLQQVVMKLSRCISIITGLDSAGRVQSVDSLTSSKGQTSSQTTSSGKGSMASLSSSSSTETDAHRPLMPSSASSSSVHSIDRDVLRVQERLVFAPSVPTFQLCQETRHLIYQGGIYRCSKGSWFKSQLLLFSDIMLIVDEQDDGSLLVSLPPVYVQDIAGIEINRKYASEFVLHLTPAAAATLPRRHGGSSSSSGNTRTITLRSPSPQEKFVWQSLLEQRVAANNGSRLQHYGSMRDISNVKTKIIL